MNGFGGFLFGFWSFWDFQSHVPYELGLNFFFGSVSYSLSWLRTYCLAKDDLEHPVLLPQTFECRHGMYWAYMVLGVEPRTFIYDRKVFY